MVRTGSRSQLIVRVPGIHGGEPIIRGTRVPVRSIVLARDEDGLDPREIAGEFRVDIAEVEAALTYYEAHKAEIDHIIDQRDRAAFEV
jgi:uncharacterized protein (DUF433 family)